MPRSTEAEFNPTGIETLYLSLTIMTALREASQGFAYKIEPYVLCSYDVDCADIADLRSDAVHTASDIVLADMACAWFADATSGREPPSWRIARRLIDFGRSGILVPSFARRCRG